MKPAVFMDRDGTINEEVGYVNHISRFTILPGAIAAVKVINEAGVMAVVVSNQSGVARGYFPESLVTKINRSLRRELENGGAALDGIYYCPHMKDGHVEPYNIDCECRKPKAGHAQKGRRRPGHRSQPLIRCGRPGERRRVRTSRGVEGLLTLTGYGRGEAEYVLPQSSVKPDFIAEDLSDAVRWILADLGTSATR